MQASSPQRTRTSERSPASARRRTRLLVVGGLALGWIGAIAGARAALLPPAKTTWIVDDDGGPGVHFSDIQAALDAAADGDLVLVRMGTYSSFTLSKNLSVIGEPGVLTNVGNVSGIDAQAAVAELAFKDFNVTGCSGTVVLDTLLGYETSPVRHPLIWIRDSADVRVLEADRAPSSGREPQIRVENSHVEVLSCYARGEEGAEATYGNPYAEWGEPAIQVLGGGRVYVSRTRATGGDGGDVFLLGGYGYGGNGGAGIEVLDGDALLLGRGTDEIRGGRGGYLALYGYAGDGGAGIAVGSGSSVRHSNVLVEGGGGGGSGSWNPGSKGPNWSVQGGGSKNKSTPPDPLLERKVLAYAGGSGQIKLRSNPGAFSRLFVGTQPTVKPTPGVLVDSLVIKQTTYALGNVPASGVLNASFPLDPSWTPGTTVYVQAMSIFPGGQIRRTNSVPLVVR